MIEKRTFQLNAGGNESVQYVLLQLPIAANARPADVTATMNQAQQIAKSASSCSDLSASAKQVNSPNPAPRDSSLSEVPADIKSDLTNLRVNQVSQPIAPATACGW